MRTIALISHASKILLHLIKRRISPIIERQLADSQMSFRKGKGTRDAIFQLRMINERITQTNTKVLNQSKKIIKGRKVYLCFVDYQKACDRVKHSKLKIIKGRKVYLCFVDYQKAFDRVKHSKLLEVMEKAVLDRY